MKRRNFLGFLGGAAVAGPNIAKSAAMGMGDLTPAGIALGNGLGQYAQPTITASGGIASAFSQVNWAKEQLKNITKASSHAREHRKRNHYFPGLDPDTASLRSISLSSKIRLARERSFEFSERQQKTYFQGIIDGLWE